MIKFQKLNPNSKCHGGIGANRVSNDTNGLGSIQRPGGELTVKVFAGADTPGSGF